MNVMHRPRPSRVLGSALLGLPALFVTVGSLAACGEEVVTVASPPTSAQYQVSFGSIKIAVAAESLQVTVFDATNAQKDGTDCLTLITKERSGADLPGGALRLGQTGVVPVCDIVLDTASDPAARKGALPAISYGKRTYLAVTKRGTADFFIGCASADLTANSAPVDIPLSQADVTVQVPDTTCATLGDKCRQTGCK